MHSMFQPVQCAGQTVKCGAGIRVLLHALPPEQLADLLRPYLNAVENDRLIEFSALIGGNIERIEDVMIFKRLLDVDAPVEPEAQQLAEAGRLSFLSSCL